MAKTETEKFWNVTIHISLPAKSKEDAEKKALKLVNQKDDMVNASIYDQDTMRCDDDEEDTEGMDGPVNLYYYGAECPNCGEPIDDEEDR